MRKRKTLVREERRECERQSPLLYMSDCRSTRKCLVYPHLFWFLILQNTAQFSNLLYQDQLQLQWYILAHFCRNENYIVRNVPRKNVFITNDMPSLSYLICRCQVSGNTKCVPKSGRTCLSYQSYFVQNVHVMGIF